MSSKDTPATSDLPECAIRVAEAKKIYAEEIAPRLREALNPIPTSREQLLEIYVRFSVAADLMVTASRSPSQVVYLDREQQELQSLLRIALTDDNLINSDLPGLPARLKMFFDTNIPGTENA